MVTFCSMRFPIIATALLCCVVCSDVRGATIIDFQFNEPAGVALVDGPANGVTPVVTDAISGYQWTANSSGDADELETIKTNGAGVLSPAGFNSTNFRDARVTLTAPHQISAAQNSPARMVVEFTPWSFSTFTTPELIRFGFGNTSATNVLAGVTLRRASDNSVTIQGISSTGAPGTGAEVSLFGNVQTEPVWVYLDVDKVNNLFSVSTKVGSGPITPLAGNVGLTLDPARNGNYLRLTFDKNFTDDTFGINRLRVATNVPESSSLIIAALGMTIAAAARRGFLSRCAPASA